MFDRPPQLIHSADTTPWLRGYPLLGDVNARAYDYGADGTRQGDAGGIAIARLRRAGLLVSFDRRSS